MKGDQSVDVSWEATKTMPPVFVQEIKVFLVITATKKPSSKKVYLTDLMSSQSKKQIFGSPKVCFGYVKKIKCKFTVKTNNGIFSLQKLNRVETVKIHWNTDYNIFNGI